MSHLAEIKRVLDICHNTALAFSQRGPAPRYVVQILFGTAAQESGFLERRQRGMKGVAGGFGLWQLERISVEDSLARLRRRGAAQDALQNYTGFVLEPEYQGVGVLDQFTSPEGDKLCCAFARLHYLWVPEPIPATVAEQAEYYVRHYNRGGKATVNQYTNNWQILCATPWQDYLVERGGA